MPRVKGSRGYIGPAFQSRIAWEPKEYRKADTRHICQLCAKPIRWALILCAVCWSEQRTNQAYVPPRA